MKYLYLALSIFLLFPSLFLSGQKVHTWYYNISPQAAKQLYQDPATLNAGMLNKALEATAFEALPTYHLLSIQNQEEVLKVGLRSRLNCEVRAMHLGRDFAVQIFDTFGKEITTAKVSVKGMAIPFQANQHVYLKKNFWPEEDGTLSVEVYGQSFFYQLNSFNQESPPLDPKRYPVQAPNTIRGYIAFCKPLFRPRDILKAKIYAAQPNGSPYLGSLQLELKTDKVWWDTVVRVQRGSYSLTLPLADTLPLDVECTLSAKAISPEISGELNHNFLLEAYQLHDVQYNFYTDEIRYNQSTPIPLHFAARTTYDAPATDVSVEIEAYDEWRSIWRSSGKLDQNGTLLIEVPNGSLPHRQLKLKFVASFTRPGAVMQQREIWVDYAPVAIDLKVEAAQVQAHAYGEPYQVWAEYAWGRQLLYSGKKPYRAPFNPMVRGYSAGFTKPETTLHLQNSERKVIYLQEQRDEQIHWKKGLDEQIHWEIKNLREQQSMVLHNPLRVPIWYQISTGEKAQSYRWTQDSLLTWQDITVQGKDLYLHYAYWWGEKWQVYKRLIPYRQQQVNIEWIAPEQIYPGQSQDLRIKVRDENGQPLSGVDLAAGAIVSEFGESLPYSPLDIYAEQFFSEPQLHYILKPLQINWEKDLDLGFYQKLQPLHEDNYYRYRYMEKGVAVDNQALPKEKEFYQQYAFVAPFVVHQHKMLPSMLVYINDTLVYFGGNAESTPYIFRCKPGYQRISIRTSMGLHELEDVYVQAGFKQNIIIDAGNFQTAKVDYQLHFTPLPDSLSTTEKNLLTQNLLIMSDIEREIYNWKNQKDWNNLDLDDPDTWVDRWLETPRQIYAWDNFGHSYTWIDQTEREYFSGLLGPFVPGSMVHCIRPFYQKQVFLFDQDSVNVKNLKKLSLADFKNLELRYRVPQINDTYEIPLPFHAPQWVQNLTGFKLDAKINPVDTAFCFPIGPDLLAKGRVIDLQNEHQPMWPVTVRLSEKKHKIIGGLAVDKQGNFELKIPDEAKYWIGFSFIGYMRSQFKTCRVDSNTFVNISLREGRPSIDLMEMSAASMVSTQMRKLDPQNRVFATMIGSKNKSSSLSKTPKYEASSLLNPITNGIRKRFSDYAFWQPTLLTDPAGEVAFSVKFPENITTWNAFAIGVDEVGEMGIGTHPIAAFKPLQAQLYMPQFLVSGDQVHIPAKVSNLTNRPTLIHTYLKQNDRTIQDSNWVASAQQNIFQSIRASSEQDSLKLEFGLQTGQYIDGEARKIPVIPAGRLKPNGQIIEITKDTLIALPFAPNTKSAKLSLTPGGMVGLLMEDILYLRQYSFGCNEQTSSKLTALLLEKSFRQLWGQEFPLEQDILKGIAILEERQQATGGWGWWVTDEQHYWVTNYVLKTLLRAQEAGYSIKVLNKGLQFLQSKLAEMQEEDYLVSLETLTKAGIKVDLTRLKNEKPDTSNQDRLYIKLLRQQLLQAHQLPYSLDTIFHYQYTQKDGSAYWAGREAFGFTGYRITDCRTQNTLIAYNILKKAGKTAELKKIRKYFLDARGFYEGDYRYGGAWRNTMEVAKILETILPDLLAESKGIQAQKVEKESLASPHTVLYGDEPFSLKLSQGDTFLIKKPKNETSTYLTFLQFTDSVGTASKQQKTSLSVKSSFGRNADSLKQNQPVQLLTAVTTWDEDINYAMIEIPIPAGCTYSSKIEVYKSEYEIHREYYADRIVIFCTRLPKGHTHYFYVSLMPQFSGKFTLNPVWVEDMYHPLENGSNVPQKIVIHP